MLIFLLFFAIEVEGDYYIQIDHTSSSNNLFFLDEGFLNPAVGSGIIGADVNPAVLASTRNIDFYTGFSLAGKGSSDFEESFEIEGVEESIEVPFGVRYNALGGMDFIGGAKKVGPISFGISYSCGNKWGIEMGLSGSVTGDFRPTEPFELTHADHPDIPIEDTIVIDIPIHGGLSIDMEDPLRLEYSSSPIFIGAGTGFGPIKLGAGLKLTNCSVLGSGSFTVLPGTFSVSLDTTASGWNVNVTGDATINDTLFYGRLDGDVRSTQTAFNLGVLLDVKLLKLSLAYEFGNSYNLTGNYNWLFSSISDFPEDFEIDTAGMEVVSDSNIIRGNVGVIFSDIPKEIHRETGSAALYFVGYNSIKAAFQLDLFLFRLGMCGSYDFPSSGDVSLRRLNAGLTLGLPFPVLNVNVGLAGSLLWLDTEDEDLDFFLPSATAGLSVSYRQDNFRVDLPLKVNITQFLVENLGELEEEGIEGVSFNLWDNISLGLGIGISL